MFIKPYQKYNKTTKERYSAYKLCKSYRMCNNINLRIIVSLGKLEEPETVGQKKMLASRTEELIKNGGNKLKFGIIDEGVEKLAHYFYTEIKQNKRYDIKHEKAEWETVNIATLKNKDGRQIGSEWLCKQALYNIIREIEYTFRVLKTDLDLRPIYHKTDGASMTHLHLGLLAYWSVASIRYQLRQKGYHSDWREIIRTMDAPKCVKTIVENIKDETISVRQCTEPTRAAKKVYDLLNFKYAPFIRKRSAAPFPEFFKMASFIIRTLRTHNRNVG